MGLSIDSILNSANEKRSIYRIRVIVKLAVDMAKDARQMGRDLLAILEKQDAEQLQVFKTPFQLGEGVLFDNRFGVVSLALELEYFEVLEHGSCLQV